MTDLPLPAGACWASEGAFAVLHTEALSNDSAVFLATHTPVERFEVDGPQSTTVRDNTEQGLREALSEASRRHAFAVIQGEPGSGKSHLIRWLAETWPSGNDVPVLLRRAEASLEGSLRGLRAAIPPKYRDVVGEIGTQQLKSMEGRIADFVSQLANSLDPGYFAKTPDDHKFCSDFVPKDVFTREVSTEWQAPARIVNLLNGSAGDGTGGERNSESASFSVYEVADLARFAPRVARTSPRAGKLLERIGDELDVLEKAQGDGIPAEKLIQTRRTEIRHSAMLVDALNARRNQAIQSSLGITADKLKGIFLDLRRALKKDGKRLVILLEDITAWEGVDDSLIDVLIIDATTANDLCDQVAVVGVTPYYYTHLKGNYLQRITHDIRLGDSTGGLQDVANLRDAETRTRFVATYLRAVRAGKHAIDAWRARHADNPAEPLPNRCEACPFGARTRCHGAFGAVDGVGLYPFSEAAIEAFFSALKPQDQGQTWKTPRGIIQGVLIPTLTRPEAFEAGTYPTREVERHKGIDRDHAYMYGVGNARLEASISDPGERDRARRMIAFWGDRNDTQTRRLHAGELAYAHVPASIFETFRVPWLGKDVDVGDGTPSDAAVDGSGHDEPTDAVIQPASGEHPSTETGQSQTSKEPTLRGPTIKLERTAPTAPTAQRKQVRATRLPPKQLNSLLIEIQAFKKEGGIKNPTLWNEMVRELLNRLDLAKLDVDEVYFSLLFRENLVKVRGTSKVGRETYFEVPTESWFIDGLEAYAQLRSVEYFQSLPPRDRDVIRRQVARCLRRLEGLACSFIAKMTPQAPDGSGWDRIPTLAQVLVIRAWLRGDVRPTAGLVEQWRAVLNHEGPSKTDPQSRVDSWAAILRPTNHDPAGMREHLSEAVRIQQGDAARSYGLADPAASIAAIQSLITEFRLVERPSDFGDLSKDSFLENLKTAAEAAQERLRRLPNDEYGRLVDRLQRIEHYRRDDGIIDHLDRVAKVVAKADQGLPAEKKQASANSWLKAKDNLLKSPGAEDRIEDVQESLVQLLNAPKPEKGLQVLDLVVAQPASWIGQVDQLMTEGEKVLEIMRTAVADYVGSGRKGSRTLEEIQAEGASIAKHAKQALVAWQQHA